VERLPAGVRDGDVVVEALAAMDAECAKAALDRNGREPTIAARRRRRELSGR